jgi:hypothetical protein
MNYDLFGLSEVVAGVIFFATLAGLGWYFTNRDDISDDSRTFR